MRESSNLKAVSDAELLRRLSDLVCQSRRAEADIVAHIAEVDARGLYARDAASSMFVWCTDVLGLSEQEAYLRITVARASRRHPMVLAMLRDGRLHLSGIALLARHLTTENRDAILRRAAGRPHRQLKELAAELEPKPDAPSGIRRLPARGPATQAGNDARLCTYRVGSPAVEPSTGGAESTGGLLEVDSGAVPAGEAGAGVAAGPRGRRATVEPLAPARHRVQFTASDELRDKLERLQALMRTTVPDGDLAAIIDLVVTEKLERLESRRFGKTKKARTPLEQTDTTPSSRHIPAPVRRAVHERDEERCTYVDRRGRRCKARDRLEFHHHGKPFGRGGDHSLENIRLMCHTHNLLLAEQDYGKENMARYWRQKSVGSPVSEAGAVSGGRSSGTTGRVPPPP